MSYLFRNFPSSFRGLHGSIVYSLTVGIKRPWHLANAFVTELTFLSHIDASHNELMVPLAGSNSTTLCCLWCKSGPISMTVNLEKRGFVPGETIRITGEFSNYSSRTVTPKAVLSQKQTFYTHERSSRIMYMKHLVTVTGDTVIPSNEVSREMSLTIPSTTSLTISNCSLLEVEYILTVNLCIKGSSDLILAFPFVMCDIPAYLAPPPY
ncbi:arrestin domain-containing protein 3-like [Aplochiton taeniatus]